MKDQQIFEALVPVVRHLETSDIPYCVGGSVASSLHGFARGTMDADLMVDLSLEHIGPLVESLKSKYYVSEPMIREAVNRRRSFNVMFLDSMFKVDIFIPKKREFDRSALLRAVRKKISGTDEGLEVWVASVEDTILFKLEWYEKGDRISERQWLDIHQMLKTNADDVDIEYLRQWAKELKFSELLEDALSEAGLK